MLVSILFPLFFALPPSSRLADIGPTPSFSLQDTQGKTVSQKDLLGKVAIVGFVFTTCNGTCPATTHRMAKLQQEVARQSGWKDRVRFVSITLDPARDDDAALRRYMELYEVDPSNWHFLTGAVPAVQKVLADFGMWARPAPNGQLDHPSRVFLLDPQGRIREIYNLDFLKTAWVLEDIALLLPQ